MSDPAPQTAPAAKEARKPGLWLWLPLALFAAFFALVFYGLLRPASTDIPSEMIGQPLPTFDLKPASSERPGLTQAAFEDGKPKLLNFFASWCIPCAAEAPVLAELAAKGATIEGIAIRDRRQDLDAFLARNGDPFQRIGLDPTSSVQLAMGSSGVPETFVIDGKGMIRYQHIGDIRPEEVPMMLEKLKEAGK